MACLHVQLIKNNRYAMTFADFTTTFDNVLRKNIWYGIVKHRFN